MLREKLPDAEVIVPFPTKYARSRCHLHCRGFRAPHVGDIVYQPLCSDPRWYQTLSSADNVKCLTTLEDLEEVSILDRVARHLFIGNEVVFLGEFSFMLAATVAWTLAQNPEIDFR